MCLDNNAMEDQARRFFEEIQINSIYELTGMVLEGGAFINLKKKRASRCFTSCSLIKEVLLCDEEGRVYSIEPTLNGLRFASGEYSYLQYLWKCKQEIIFGGLILIVSLGVFVSLGWGLVKYFS